MYIEVTLLLLQKKIKTFLFLIYMYFFWQLEGWLYLIRLETSSFEPTTFIEEVGVKQGLTSDHS